MGGLPRAGDSLGDRPVPVDPLTCIACGQEPPFQELFERDGFRLVRCPNCGLGFQDPQPSDEELAKTYYHDAAFSEALFGELRDWTFELAESKLGQVKGLVSRDGPLRVLDVGCSSGAWLEVAERQGWRATGVELGEATAEAARGRGLDVRTGTLADAAGELAGERFDLITFWDVLEHVREPRRELELSAGLLAEDGLVAVSCPNLAGLYPSVTRRLFARRFGVWEYPELPVHTYDFTPDTLTRLFEGSGFARVALRTSGTPFRHYRGTTLSLEALGGGARGRLLRGAFEALHAAIYPLARLAGRGNYMFAAARKR